MIKRDVGDARDVARNQQSVDRKIERYLYVIQDKDTRLYKIGITNNPYARFNRVGKGMDHIELILMVKAKQSSVLAIEKSLHTRLAAFNCPHPLATESLSEWYKLDDVLLGETLKRIQEDVRIIAPENLQTESGSLGILRRVIKCWREAEGLSLRTMAAEIGIEYTALHRLEQGEEMNGTNLCRLVVWLLSPEKDVK